MKTCEFKPAELLSVKDVMEMTKLSRLCVLKMLGETPELQPFKWMSQYWITVANWNACIEKKMKEAAIKNVKPCIPKAYQSKIA
ncbi:MAG: hypothetical protein WCP79_06795 [Bacillota bacterium]